MITLQSVSKEFSGLPALRSISMSFEGSKTHVILGSSGCGKSTMLRIIVGILSPDRGEIWVNDTLLTPDSQPLLAEQMGYVIQEGGLFPHLTCRQNVALKAALLRWPKDKIETRISELSELMGLDPKILLRYPGEVSGGQRQRVSLMRALMLNPSILLLDEPLGALDPIVRHSLQNELRALFDRLRKTVILVTHDLGEAAFFGNRVTLMNQGRIVQQGTFSDLIRSPADPFVSEFINAQRPVAELRVPA